MNDKTKLLVVEDEESIRNNLATLLRLEGFDVMVAENGKEALALIKQDLPEIVLSDVMMPVMDGHSLLEELRADPITNAIPLIFITAKGERTDVRESMNLGADDYITKPFQRDELLETVRARLKRLHSRQAAHQKLQSEAKRLLHHDPLTRLPNRMWLGERVEAAMSHARRNRSRIALLIVGLDGFGRINDAFGRDAGDKLLRETSGRLQTLVNGAPLAGAFDAVCRVSGDEFAVLIEGFGSVDYLGPYGLQLIGEISRPVDVCGQDIFVSGCLGISVWEEENEVPATALVEQAETALRQAKSSGPGTRTFYSAEISRMVSRRIHIHNELHHALSANQLSLYYQPQVEISSGRIVGCEALMRWRHPEMGFISPAEFIPVAEEDGLIVQIGDWALRTACAQARAWFDGGIPVRVAVNLSTKQVLQEDIHDTVKAAMQDASLPAELLELEITESIAMSDVETVISTLRSFKSLGIAMAMDDFGTGYSSLSYLKRLPLDVLKIDQSFVRNITTDPGDAAISRAVVAMAHSFGMSVIAEGVETRDHLAFLEDLACEVAQGYLFSKPLPAAEATEFFRQHFGK